MSVDGATVRRIAHLARIAVAEQEVPHLQGELNAILAFVEQLSEVDVEGVEPMTSVTPMEMKKRQDVVDDGEIADFVAPYVHAKTDEEIAAFNRDWLRYGPEPGTPAEGYFLKLRGEVAPDRTDVTVWADLLDLDEKRPVPHRTAA